MSLQAAVIAIKAANAPLVAMVGARFYENALPQQAVLPAVKFQIISKPNDKAMGPRVVNYRPRIQFDGYVDSVRGGGTTTASALRDAIFTAFFGASGSYGSQTVKAVLLDTEHNDIEMLDTNTEADHVRMEFLVDYE